MCRELGTGGRVTSRLKNGQRKGGRRNPQTIRRNRGNGSAFPQQLQASIQVDKTIRFKASSVLSDAVISVTDLLDLLAVATTATAAFGLARSVKIRALEMWSPPDSAGAAVVASIEDSTAGTSSVSGSSRRVEDVTMGQNRPAHVMYRPAAGSAQALWHVLDSDLSELLKLSGPVGSTIDFHVSFILQDGEAPDAVTAAVAGATAGKLYIRSLNSNGANNLVPVSFATI